MRRNHYLLLLVGASLGVVMLGFPYMAFLPIVADGMFDVGAGGYGLMSAVASVGAVSAALVAAQIGSRAELVEAHGHRRVVLRRRGCAARACARVPGCA